jgi:hypothetical protein
VDCDREVSLVFTLNGNECTPRSVGRRINTARPVMQRLGTKAILRHK